MARFPFEKRTRVYWVTAIANKSAPTVAELNAGTDISCFLTKDGLQTPSTQNMVDAGALCENFDAQRVGSFGGPITLKGFRDDQPGSDTLWNLCVYGTNGFLAVRRGPTHATAWAAAQKAEVYPAEMHNPVSDQTATNAMTTFTEMLAVTEEPDLKATVAA